MDSDNFDSSRSNDSSNGGRLHFEWNGAVEPSTAVAEAVASATDREPTALEPIHASIDTDALDSLLRPTKGGTGDSVHISFRYEGMEVSVDSEHGIEIKPETTDDSDR